MEFDEIVIKGSPGLCRCCLSEGCYKDLSTEYTWMDDNEVYAEMLLECFDISISQHNEGPNGPNRLICEVCITRLRDACNFKKQVLASEKKFVDMVGRGAFKSKVVVYQAPIKVKTDIEESHEADVAEIEYLEDDMDFGDGDLLKDDDAIDQSLAEDITVETLPVKGKRGRPRKNALAVQADKRVKLPKTEEKPKASKAIAKGNPKTMADARLAEKRRKDELAKLLAAIIEHSNIMPFKWYANKYMCFYCCCPFVDSASLKVHTREEHKGPKPPSLLRAVIGHSRIKLDISEARLCGKCPKVIQTLEEFLQHVQTHAVSIDEQASRQLFAFRLSDEGMGCVECGQRFRFFGPLLAHSHRLHNKTAAYLCEICGQGFVAKANVDSHVRSVHTVRRSRSHREQLRCPKCPEVLTSRYLRKRHLALVHDVKSAQFACSQCPKVFTEMSTLVQHNARVHLRERAFACDVCGFRVFSGDLLRRHMVRHDDSRPHQCEFCKKCFQRKKTLDFHRRIHTNDRRYACKECGKAFVQVTSLKLHIRVHHEGAK